MRTMTRTWRGWAWTIATHCSRGQAPPTRRGHTKWVRQNRGASVWFPQSTGHTGMDPALFQASTLLNGGCCCTCMSGVSFHKQFFYCINDVGECTFCIFKLKKMKSNWKKQVLKTPETSLYTPLINVDFFCPRPRPPLLPARLSFWMRPLLSCSCVSGLSWLLHACVLSRRVCSYDWLHGSHCPLQAE